MNDTERWRRAALQRLESLERAGVRQLPRVAQLELPGETETAAPPTPATDSAAAIRSQAAPATPVATPGRPARGEPDAGIAASDKPGATLSASAGDRLSPAEAAQRLASLAAEVAACRACEQLCQSRTQTVFGVGNPQPRLCFFGEAPGADEDRQGEPFVGAAGQLLNKIIQAMSLRREDVYILNTIKCRPPENRNPSESEIANCRGYFERQLEILKPEFICCLGAVAAQTLLGVKQSVGKLRGRIHAYGDARVVVTYHPAYLLRTESAKRLTWEDMKLLIREMGLTV